MKKKFYLVVMIIGCVSTLSFAESISKNYEGLLNKQFTQCANLNNTLLNNKFTNHVKGKTYKGLRIKEVITVESGAGGFWGLQFNENLSTVRKTFPNIRYLSEKEILSGKLNWKQVHKKANIQMQDGFTSQQNKQFPILVCSWGGGEW